MIQEILREWFFGLPPVIAAGLAVASYLGLAVVAYLCNKKEDEK